MSNAFFEKLVADRREGIAPPQVAEPTAGSSPNAEPSLQVNFYPAPYDGLSTCGRCCALLVTDYAPTHADWHRQLGH